MKPISSWLESHAAFDPDREMLRAGGRVWTRAELARAADDLAAWLTAEAGLRKGARAAFLGYSRAELLILVFAAAKAGVIVVPLNWRLAAAEQRAILQDAGADLLIAQEPFAARAEEIAPEGCAVLLCGGEADGFAAALEAGASAARTGGGEAKDPLLLVYTSGTTGAPKGAVLTQEAVLYNALNAIHMHDMTADDVVLSVLPLFHVGGLNIQTLPVLYCGGRVILHETFDPAATLAAIGRERPTLLVQVPATLAAIMALPEWESADVSSLRAVAIGSTDVPVELIEAGRARGLSVIQIYGATETGPVTIYQKRGEAGATIGSIGREGLHTEIRLVDESGADVAPGETGEILVRGPHVASGYWKKPGHPAFAGGWFHSGDMASRDEAGLFRFRGRRKHMIISGGENIYPAEIERVLRAVPGVAECAVTGLPDEKWGETPGALIVPEEGAQLTEADIRAALEGALARYKHPRRIRFVKALPRNVMSKVVLAEVREILLGEKPPS